MKKAAPAALALALALMLAACQRAPKTPEELIARTQAALAETPCTQVGCEMEMAMSIEMLGTEVGLKFNMQQTSDATAEPAALHSVADGTVELMGQSVPANSESYVVADGDGWAEYTLSDGAWSKATATQGDTVLAPTYPTQELAMEADVDCDGANAWRLTGVCPGADMAQSFGMVLDAGEATGLENVTADIVLYVDAKTWRPLREELTFRGMDEALASTLAMQENMAELTDLLGMGVTGSTAAMTIRFTSYEAGEAITLPEEAQNAA